MSPVNGHRQRKPPICRERHAEDTAGVAFQCAHCPTALHLPQSYRLIFGPLFALEYNVIFCPNCGKHCDNGNYCAGCGTTFIKTPQVIRTELPENQSKICYACKMTIPLGGSLCPHCRTDVTPGAQVINGFYYIVVFVVIVWLFASLKK